MLSVTELKVQSKNSRPLVLALLDGWGVSAKTEGNAIKAARTPFLDESLLHYPCTNLFPAGRGATGQDEMIRQSSSYRVLGAGNPLGGPKARIDEAIKNKSFYRNEALVAAMAHVKKHNSKLHLIGLVSSSDIHSSLSHLNALLVFAYREGIRDVFLHAILDGRDTSARHGEKIITEVIKRFNKKKIGRVVTLAGRFYAQDENANYDRTKRTFEAMRGRLMIKKDPLAYIRASYAKKIFDEDIMPVMFDTGLIPGGRIENNDSVIFFNFHPSGLRQLVKIFILASERKARQPLKNINLVIFTEYENDWPVKVAFPVLHPKNTLGKSISLSGRRQKRISVAENHILLYSFFDNGENIENCERSLIELPRKENYAAKPTVGLDLILKQLIRDLNSDIYDFLLIGLPNCDLAARAGDYKAAIKAVEATDRSLAKIAREVFKKNGILVVASPYGCAEKMSEREGDLLPNQPSLNPVPFLVIKKDLAGLNLGWPDVAGGDLAMVTPVGTIADIAPTILKLMGINQPKEMAGHSLI